MRLSPDHWLLAAQAVALAAGLVVARVSWRRYRGPRK